MKLIKAAVTRWLIHGKAVQKVLDHYEVFSAIHRVFFGICICAGTRTLTKVFRDHTIRQSHQQMLWLYLAAFRCQTTKQS